MTKAGGRFILHASNVHCGGGLSLLLALLSHPEASQWICLLDKRNLSKKLPIADNNIHWVEPSISKTLAAEYKLRQICKKNDTVLCFHNQPPLFKLSGKVIVFNQNRLLHDFVWQKFTWRMRCRFLIKCVWFRLTQSHADFYLVQTTSMARILSKVLGYRRKVKVSPLIAKLALAIDSKHSDKLYDFVYPASGEAHKNHLNLLAAWKLLAAENIYPTLALSVDSQGYPKLAEALAECQKDNPNIINLEWLKPEQMPKLYSNARALIYPSLLESFGLPLLEAQAMQLPIIAAELDYVRDLVDPAQSFDPNSAESISRAVKRHLGISDTKAKPIDAEQFIADIMPLSQ